MKASDEPEGSMEAAAAFLVTAAAPAESSKAPMSATFLWLVVRARPHCLLMRCLPCSPKAAPGKREKIQCRAIPTSRFYLLSSPCAQVFGCVAGSGFGYDTGVVSGALPSARTDLQMSTLDVQWFVSSTTLAAAFTALISPPLTGSYGRRPMVIVAGALFVMGASFVSSAEHVRGSIFGRAVLGVAVGLVATIVPMYVSELSPRERRGATVMLYDLSIVLGQLLAGLVNCVTFYSAHGWRLSMGLAVVPAFGMLLSLLPLPESPRWFVRKGRVVEAEVGLILMAGDSAAARETAMAELKEVRDTIAAEDAALRANANYASGSKAASGAVDSEGKALPPSDDDDPDYNCAEVRDSGGGLCGGGSGGSLRAVLALWGERPLRRAALLGILMGALNQLSGINTIMYYAGTIFNTVFKPEVAVWLSMLCNLAQLLGVGLSLLTIDSHGRRQTALRSCFFVAASLTGLAVVFGVANPDIDRGNMSVPVKAAVVSLIMLYLIAFGAGLSGVGTVIISEIYPMRVRGVGVAQATFISWMCNYGVSQTFLTLTADHSVGYAGAFGLYAGFAVLGGLLLYRYLPETAGMRLEQIEELFADPYPRDMPTSVVGSGSPDEGTALLAARGKGS